MFVNEIQGFGMYTGCPQWYRRIEHIYQSLKSDHDSDPARQIQSSDHATVGYRRHSEIVRFIQSQISDFTAHAITVMSKHLELEFFTGFDRIGLWYDLNISDHHCGVTFRCTTSNPSFHQLIPVRILWQHDSSAMRRFP